MKLLILIIVFLFFLHNATCQNILKEKTQYDTTPASWNKIKRPLAIYFLGGVQINTNPSFQNWLSDNGVKSSSALAFTYGLDMILPSKYFIWEAELLNARMKNPNQSDLGFCLYGGKMYKKRSIYITPWFGIGILNSQVKFSNPPTSLAGLNFSNGSLLRNYAEITPKLLVAKRFPGYINSLGVEIGCRAYFSLEDWKYVGGGQSMSIPEIPGLSLLHPFMSIIFGFQTDNYKR